MEKLLEIMVLFANNSVQSNTGVSKREATKVMREIHARLINFRLDKTRELGVSTRALTPSKTQIVSHRS